MHVGNQVNCESRFFVSAQPICRSNRDLKIIARHPRKDTLDTHSPSHSLTRSVSQSVSQAAGSRQQAGKWIYHAKSCNLTWLHILPTGCMRRATDNIAVVHATLTSNKIKGKSQPITKITPIHQHKQTKWCGTRNLEPQTRVRAWAWAQKAKNVAPKAPLHWYFKHCQGA